MLNCAIDCDPHEDECISPADYGTSSSTETRCPDDADNDCDGDPACPSCLASGEMCTSDSRYRPDKCRRGQRK